MDENNQGPVYLNWKSILGDMWAKYDGRKSGTPSSTRISGNVDYISVGCVAEGNGGNGMTFEGNANGIIIGGNIRNNRGTGIHASDSSSVTAIDTNVEGNGHEK